MALQNPSLEKHIYGLTEKTGCREKKHRVSLVEEIRPQLFSPQKPPSSWSSLFNPRDMWLGLGEINCWVGTYWAHPTLTLILWRSCMREGDTKGHLGMCQWNWCHFVLSFLLGVKERVKTPSSCCCEWWMDCLEGYASFGSSLSCMIFIYSSRIMGFGFWGWQRFKGWQWICCCTCQEWEPCGTWTCLL